MIFKKNKNLKVIIVGPPRSGTSFLTSLVHKITDYNVGEDDDLRAPDPNNKFGYFEFVELMSITEEILKLQGGDYHNLPEFETGWINKYKRQKRRIKKIVNKNNLELYKDNKVLCLADFYNDIYPNAKWIFIQRNVNDTFKSRFGEYIDYDKWVEISGKRLKYWFASEVSKRALSIRYESFYNDMPNIVDIIANHLSIELTDEKRQECYNLFKPRNSTKEEERFVSESYGISESSVWEKYVSNPEFPYLVSFPRTGSHWLRNVMELYFEKPSLTRVFYYRNPTDFTCFHIHDEDLSFNENKRIIYLYRDPVETIYSQMNFYNEDINDIERIEHWANIYGKHLQKWLLNDNLSIEKVVLTYEGLKHNFNDEFNKLMVFLNNSLDNVKLKKALNTVSKEQIKNRVQHDPRVINSSKNYSQNREVFKLSNEVFIRRIILKIDNRLSKYF